MAQLHNPVINLAFDAAAAEVHNRVASRGYSNIDASVRFAVPVIDGLQLMHAIYTSEDTEGLNYLVAHNPDTLECLPIPMPALSQSSADAYDIRIPAINLGRENLKKLNEACERGKKLNEVSGGGHYENPYDILVSGLRILDALQEANRKDYTQVVLLDAPDSDTATRGKLLTVKSLARRLDF